MKVMVTGAQGQLGRCLQDRLAGSAHEVVAVGRDELDITDAVAVNEFVRSIRPDVIINAAAYTAVDKAEAEGGQAWAVNAAAVENLAAAVNEVEALLLHVSTDYVFDGSASRPYRECDLVNPTGVYGASKLAGEKAAEKARRHLVVRTAWVFSEYGHNFLKTMVRLAGDKNSLSIVNDQIGTPTYAGDLAGALIQLCEMPLQNGTYHFSGGDSCTWFEFARAIFETCTEQSSVFVAPSIHPIPTSEFPTPAQRPAYSVLDAGKIWKEASVASGDWQRALADVCEKVLRCR